MFRYIRKLCATRQLDTGRLTPLLPGDSGHWSLLQTGDQTLVADEAMDLYVWQGGTEHVPHTIAWKVETVKFDTVSIFILRAQRGALKRACGARAIQQFWRGSDYARRQWSLLT